jgi:hypothetical protein
VYAAEGYDSAVATAFQQATGIPTSVYNAHTKLVVSKIEQEKNNPRWGVAWFGHHRRGVRVTELTTVDTPADRHGRLTESKP